MQNKYAQSPGGRLHPSPEPSRKTSLRQVKPFNLVRSRWNVALRVLGKQLSIAPLKSKRKNRTEKGLFRAVIPDLGTTLFAWLNLHLLQTPDSLFRMPPWSKKRWKSQQSNPLKRRALAALNGIINVCQWEKSVQAKLAWMLLLLPQQCFEVRIELSISARVLFSILFSRPPPPPAFLDFNRHRHFFTCWLLQFRTKNTRRRSVSRRSRAGANIDRVWHPAPPPPFDVDLCALLIHWFWNPLLGYHSSGTGFDAISGNVIWKTVKSMHFKRRLFFFRYDFSSESNSAWRSDTNSCEECWEHWTGEGL